MRPGLTTIAAALVGALLVGGGVLVGARLTDDASEPASSAAPASVQAADADDADAREVPPLDLHEEALVGGWSRYHSYDGSRQYAIFNADRTGCEWDKTASGSVKSDNSFDWWEIGEESADGTLYVAYGEPGNLWGGWAFDYAADELYMGEANLIGSRDPDVTECFS